ncbi:MAG: hypothetical protein AB1540_13140 [Bdellovibrionota bacterium]
MRILFSVVALMGLSSSFALADTSMFNTDNRDGCIPYRCNVRAEEKGARCTVKGEICSLRGSEAAVDQRGGPRISMEVDCTNGFELEDRRVEVFSSTDRALLRGEEDDKSADLELRANGSSNDTFRAHLTTAVDGGSSYEYHGRCHIGGRNNDRPRAE